MPDATKYSSSLTSKRVLVIGGSSGIGFCVAEACVEHGALVVIASSNQQRVDSAVEKIEASYPSAAGEGNKRRIWGVTVDLSKQETLEEEVEGVLDRAVGKIGGQGEGKLDHVVYTAGDRLAETKIGDMTLPSIIAAGQLRFFAPLLLAKHIPRYLVPSPSSSYTISTGSVSEKPIPNWSAIGAYAGGIHSMVRGLALDLAPIRVNGVSPGVVDTELWDHLDAGDGKGGGDGGKRQQVLEGLGKGLLTGRVGTPQHVAQSYLGIMRDGNVDGSMVRTDGGGLIV